MAKRVIVLERDDSYPTRWSVVFWLVPPAARQPFYARPDATSAWGGASQAEVDAIKAGQVVEERMTFSRAQSQTVPEVQAFLETEWSRRQATIDAANPWVKYGTYWDGATWTAGGVS